MQGEKRKCRWCNLRKEKGRYKRTSDRAVLSGRIFVCSDCLVVHERHRQRGPWGLTREQARAGSREVSRLQKKIESEEATEGDRVRYQVGLDLLVVHDWGREPVPRREHAVAQTESRQPTIQEWLAEDGPEPGGEVPGPGEEGLLRRQMQLVRGLSQGAGGTHGQAGG